jgi:hypothetical protein
VVKAGNNKDSNGGDEKMREIKFRAWDKEMKLMRWLTQPGYSYGIIHLEEIFTEDRFIPMQFTGLKDKNGKEIWEGDIVKYGYSDFEEDKTIHQIVWCGNDYPAFDLSPDLGIECNGLSHAMNEGEIEVIGNIYENPELLKKGDS